MGQISASQSGAGSVSTQLLRSSINFLHIVLMVTAAAAPVVASTYIPISMAAGAGMATALTYAATTAILLIFSVGFARWPSGSRPPAPSTRSQRRASGVRWASASGSSSSPPTA